MCLDELSSISVEAIRQLGKFEGYVILSLNGIKSLTPEIAKELAKIK
jgi:hypothetical protein